MDNIHVDQTKRPSKKEPAKAAEATPMAIEPALTDDDAAEGGLPGLALPKPEPKKKGRKKPFG